MVTSPVTSTSPSIRPADLEVALAADASAKENALSDHRDVRHASSSNLSTRVAVPSQTSMSTLPLNEAPSAIVRREALTSPTRRPPGMEIDAIARGDVAGDLPADRQRRRRDVGLDDRAALDVDGVFRLSLPRSVP